MILDAALDAVNIMRSGVLAREFCRQHAHAEVAAVFERSLYLRSAGMFVCLGVPAVGNGPLTLIADFRPSRVRQDESVLISERGITIGDTVCFNFDQCEEWQPQHWPRSLSRRQLIDVGNAIAARSAIEAPAEGLGRVHEQGRGETPFARLARPRIAHFASWLTGVLEADRVPTAESVAVHGLIGLGPGLTPSGDDFLAGALALLDALAQMQAHAALAGAIKASQRGLTSPLSGCLLRAAATGHIGEHLHHAIAAVISGDVDTAVVAARNVGHCSGWDMLAGAVTALGVVASARSPCSRRRP
jgi:hypothetical protein